MVATELPATYIAPLGYEIQDQGVDNWLRLYGFTQTDINTLGNNAAADDYFSYCWLYNCDFTVADAGCVSVSVIGTTSEGGYIKTATVQLIRKAPLGAIIGDLCLYANGNKKPIDEWSVEFFGDNNNPKFPIAPTNGTVTQTVTATLNNSVRATTITAEINPFIPDEPGGDV